MKALLVASILGVLGLPSPAAAGGLQVFQTPSKNIGCIYEPAEAGQPAFLRCDIGTGLKPRPPKPKGCVLAWGLGYEMTKTGRAHDVCAGDTARDLNARTLPYGTTWRSGGFTCISRRTGLRCMNAVRRGFFLSRKRTYTF